jgi:hypothetical protein
MLQTIEIKNQEFIEINFDFLHARETVNLVVWRRYCQLTCQIINDAKP